MGEKINSLFSPMSEDYFAGISEIRIRTGKPLTFTRYSRERFIDGHGKCQSDPILGYCPEPKDIQEALSLMSDYSLYAFEEELRSGYITLSGGHRVGVSGQAVIENKALKTMKNISGFNIRVSHEIKGCADSVIGKIALPQLMHTMIISPPACGKTTLLRDVVRQLSNGVAGKFPGVNVGVADERSEIAGCYRGVPQNDVGIRTDVLDGCPKDEGMLILLRAMSPRVIAVDELGGRNDIRAVEDIVNAGVCLICTVHGRDLEDARQRMVLGELINRGIFERFVVLKAVGKIAGVYGRGGESA
jgi:stage III sporulation protein AA